MKKLQKVMASTFIVGTLATLLYTLGLLSWEYYGIGLYWYEAALLVGWMLIMYGTSLYYGILIAVLYPEELKKKFAARKFHHM